jgi:ATP synthase protein I
MTAATPPPNGGQSGDHLGGISPSEREAFKRRADELGKRLDAAKGPVKSAAETADQSKDASANSNALGKAMRISTELIGGIVVGAGLGWLIDKALGTWPAFFIGFFLLGSAAGIMNVVRAGAAMKTGPNNPKAGPSVRDDDDDAK